MCKNMHMYAVVQQHYMDMAQSVRYSTSETRIALQNHATDHGCRNTSPVPRTYPTLDAHYSLFGMASFDLPVVNIEIEAWF